MSQQRWRRPASKWAMASVLLLALGAIAISLGSFHAWRPSLATTEMAANLVDSKEEKEPPPRYKATQFISFTINTFGGLADHGECEGRPVDDNGMCYLGSSNITEGIIHRAKIVAEALKKLKEDIEKNDPEIDHSDNVLKIFAMPEFYWRSAYGAYTFDVFEDVLMEVFARFGEIIKDEVFQNYLFIFGTVIVVKAPDETSQGEDMADMVQQAEYSNFCPVAKGGPTHHHAFLVTKKYISTADFFSRTLLPNPRNYDVTEYSYNDFSKRFQNVLDKRNIKFVQDNVLRIDGLTIGLEICLDHNVGTLWESLQKNYNSELVDVLVVTSAGMSLERGPNPLNYGGVAYLCDGTASSAACIRTDKGPFDPDKVCRAVKPDGIKHIPTGGTNFSEFFPMSACIDVEKIDLLKGYFSLYQTQGCAYTLKLYGIDVMDEFDYYPPSVEIYPVVDLPSNAYEINH